MRNNRGISLVVLMIIIASVSLISRIAIKQVLTLTISWNQTSAQEALKVISIALENFAKDNNNVYPLKIDSLAQGNPPYLNRDYFTGSYIRGYNYACPTLDAGGYSCIASPTTCHLTGETVFTVNTGSVITSQKCE